MSNKKTKFDILLVPRNSAGKVKKVRISYSAFKVFLIVNFIVILLLIGALFYAFGMNKNLRHINTSNEEKIEGLASFELQKKNEELSNEVAFLKKKIFKNFKTIQDINAYQSKIKSFMSTSDSITMPEGGYLKKNTENAYEFDMASYARVHDPELAIDLSLKSELTSELLDDYNQYITKQLDLLNQSTTNLYGRMVETSQMLLSTPSIWPVRGWLSSSFGVRNDPFSKNKKFHEGLDIANNPGLPIKATANGVVTFAGVNGGYGNAVIIDHLNNLQTRYAHMQSFIVRSGQQVKKGQVIGYLGNSGRSSGPHLHYEVRKHGIPVNPKLYIIE